MKWVTLGKNRVRDTEGAAKQKPHARICEGENRMAELLDRNRPVAFPPMAR